MDKYYTPAIEEFHVGFEYERLSTSGEWTEEVLDYSSISSYAIEDVLEDMSYGDTIRVKYLDQEDIESLGWRQVKDYDDEKVFQILPDEHDFYELSWFTDEDAPHNINIEFWYETKPCVSNCDTIFRGTLKNKSELKVLIRQLNIKQHEHQETS